MNEEVNRIIKKNKQKREKMTLGEKKSTKEISLTKFYYIKKLITRTLLAIIFVLISIIFTKTNEKNKELYQHYVLNNSLEFTKINELYKSIFGKVDFTNKKDNSKSVFFNSIKYSNIENYKNGVKLTVGMNEIVNVITSGIIVYVGEKEDLGNTIIIQGNDGVDIWYSNITDTDITVYDYVESGSILGTSNSDYIYLTIQKDGKYLSYEEYKNLI